MKKIDWTFFRDSFTSWRGIFFAILAIALLVGIANGPSDAPFLYRGSD